MTRRQYLYNGHHHIWRSRDHRKGLRPTLRFADAGAWRPESLNLWIGGGFLAGSSLFVAGAVLSLSQELATLLALSATQVNSVYFLGSIFFTVAAYLQLFQSANSGALPDGRPLTTSRVLIGWQPHQIGWLSSFLQFLGTLLFNASTFVAVGSLGSWLWQDLTIWGPDLFGSVLFLSSGYLAFIETCHRYWSWRPWDLSWWVVLVNLMGCVAFMISAIYAYVPSGGAGHAFVTVSVAGTLVGAIGFLAGSALMLAESRASTLQT